MTGFSKPLSTRHSTTGPQTHAHPTPYRTYHPQTQTRAQQRPLVEVTRLDATLDIRHNPSSTQVNNPILRPTAPSTLLPPSSWHDTIDMLKQEQLTRSSPFTPACSLSPFHFKALVSKPSLSHKAPLFFSLCFLDEMV